MRPSRMARAASRAGYQPYVVRTVPAELPCLLHQGAQCPYCGGRGVFAAQRVIMTCRADLPDAGGPEPDAGGSGAP